MNDMPQSEPAGQEQMASVQQARLGPSSTARVARTRIYIVRHEVV